MDDDRIPGRFGKHFLNWYKAKTEARCTLRWRGLDEAVIASIEQANEMRFPPDYRLFLAMMGTSEGRAEGGDGANFMRWTPGSRAITNHREWLAKCLADGAENEQVWQPEWGSRPDTREARLAVIEAAVAAAPRLIPVAGFSCLLAEPCVAGNPLLSTYGLAYALDIKVIGRNLHEFLSSGFVRTHPAPETEEAEPEIDEWDEWDGVGVEIPFWGALLEHNICIPTRAARIEINGAAFETLDGFFDAIARKLTPGVQWERSLAGLDAVLRGAPGTPAGGIVLIWKDAWLSRVRLGPAVFDTLVKMIREHGPGGAAPHDRVGLRLR